MSEKWSGFTDEDIQRIKSNPSGTKSCSETVCELDGYNNSSLKSKGPMKIKRVPLKCDVDDGHLENVYEVNAIHSTSKAQEFDSGIELASQNDEQCTCNGYTSDIEEYDTVNGKDVPEEIQDQKCGEVDERHSTTNLLSLDEFEMRQKRVEAENGRRRALISKAINDKRKHTQAEAIKLAKITQELSHIDSNLSADVSILRDYIEKASFEFSEAEKRYLRAEKEFVDAKMFLFEKMQRKEMLTEHLCAIIEQNENRKADKLVELMKQLEMEVLLDDCELNALHPILPNLCTLNDEPYHTCQTIKPALSRGNSHHSVQENTVDDIDQKPEQCNAIEASGNASEESAPNNIKIEKYPSVESPEK